MLMKQLLLEHIDETIRGDEEAIHRVLRNGGAAAALYGSVCRQGKAVGDRERK